MKTPPERCPLTVQFKLGRGGRGTRKTFRCLRERGHRGRCKFPDVP